MVAEVAQNTDWYMQLVRESGSVVVAMVLIGGFTYMIGKSVVVPSLRLAVVVTTNLKEAVVRAHDTLVLSEKLTDLPRSVEALTVQVNRVESTATRLERVGG